MFAKSLAFVIFLFIPFFIQGRRYTFNDVQYTLEDNTLIPVGDTSFSNDPAFSYKSSNLKKWMEEKYKGRIKTDDVVSIGIEDIRLGGPQKIEEILFAFRERPHIFNLGHGVLPETSIEKVEKMLLQIRST